MSVPSHSARIIDGDTVELQGQRYDFKSFDAPEWDQTCLDGEHLWPCGEAAAFELKKIFTLEDLTCETEKDGTDNKIVSCLAGNRSVGEIMVSSGLALASDDRAVALTEAQNYAQSAGIGMWRGDFMQPADWRATPEAERAGLTTPQRCVLLPASTDVADSHMFSLPTDEHYAEARRDAVPLCTVEQAEADGWALRPSP